MLLSRKLCSARVVLALLGVLLLPGLFSCGVLDKMFTPAPPVFSPEEKGEAGRVTSGQSAPGQGASVFNRDVFGQTVSGDPGAQGAGGRAPARVDAAWYDGGWAHEASDIPPDSSITFGKLPNGFRYAVIPNSLPSGRVMLYLNVQAGSLMEEDHERGAAHFVEHMAFNGSRFFPPESLVPFFQSQGMSFGGDSNAHTGWAETVYKLNLAASDKDTVAKGLLVLRDFADGLLFIPGRVETERGVILAEKAARDNEAAKAARERDAVLYAGTRFAHDVIGTDQTLRSLSPDTLRAFYRKWYQPERMMLVAVGEVDPERMAYLVNEYFCGMEASKQVTPVPFWGDPMGRGLRAWHQVRPITSTSITVYFQHPRVHRRDSQALFKDRLVQSMMSFCLRQRLQERGEREPGIWQQAGFGGDMYGILPRLMLTASTSKEGWRKTMNALSQELRGALEYGFSGAELERAVDAYRKSLELALSRRAGRSSEQIAAFFTQAANMDRVFTSEAADLFLFEKLVPGISAQDLHEALKRATGSGSTVVCVSGDAEIPGGTGEILAEWQSAARQPVSEYQAVKLRQFPYLPLPPEAADLPALKASTLVGRAAFGAGLPAAGAAARASARPAASGPAAAPGQAVAAPGAQDLVLYSTRLANGVEVRLLPVPFEKDKVYATLLFGPGNYAISNAEYPLMYFSEAVLKAGGLGNLTKAETSLLFEGSGLYVNERHTFNSTRIEGGSSRADLPRLLEAVWTQYKDPTPQESARVKVIEGLGMSRYQRYESVDGMDRAESAIYFYGPSKRFALLEEEDARSYSLKDLMNFLAKNRRGAAQGPMSVVISGDFDPAQVLPQVARLFGPENCWTPESGLPRPERQAPAPVFPEKRRKTIQVADQVEKAVLRISWKANLEDEQDRVRVAARNLLAAVLSERMRVEIREKLGATYSPFAFFRHMPDDGGFGMLQAGIGSELAHLKDVIPALHRVAIELADKGVGAEELERIKNPMRTAWRSDLEQARLWHGLILRELESGRPYPRWQAEYLQTLNAVAPALISKEARNILHMKTQASMIVKTQTSPEEPKVQETLEDMDLDEAASTPSAPSAPPVQAGQAGQVGQPGQTASPGRAAPALPDTFPAREGVRK